MVGVFKADGKGFVGLNHILVDGKRFDERKRCFDFVGPSDGALRLAVLAHGAHADLELRIVHVERSVYHVSRPRSSGGKEGFLFALLDKYFVVPGTHFFVVDGATVVFSLARAAERHVEDHLEVGAVVHALHYFGVGDLRRYGCFVEVGGHECELAEEDFIVVGRSLERQASATNHVAALQAEGRSLDGSGVPLALLFCFGQSHKCKVVFSTLLRHHEAGTRFLARVNLVNKAELVVFGSHIPLRGKEAHIGAHRLAVEFEARTAEPSVVVSKVSLDGLGGHGLAVAIVNPPAPRGQQVLHAPVVPLVVPGRHAFIVHEAAVTEVEARHEGHFAQRGTLAHGLGIAVPRGEVGEGGRGVARVERRQLEHVAVGAGEEEFLLLLILVLHGVVALAAFGGAYVELAAVVCAPNYDADGILHQRFPTCVAVLTETASLHVETGIHVERGASVGFCRGHAGRERTCAPVVVEEEHIRNGLSEFIVVEPFIVIRAQRTAVVGECARVAHKGVPVHVERPALFLGHFVANCEEFHEGPVNGCAPFSFGIEADAVDAVVAEEVDELFGIDGVTFRVLCREFEERLARFVRLINRSTPVDKVGATRLDTVLVGHVVECTGHAPPTVAPVGVDVDILPEVEVVGIEIVARHRTPLLGHFTRGSAPAKVFVGSVSDLLIGVNAGQELLLHRHARDEEILVLVIGIAVEGLAGFPVFECIDDAARHSVANVRLMRRHTLCPRACGNEGS